MSALFLSPAEQGSKMANKRNCFSLREQCILKELVTERKHILESRKSDMHANFEKRKIWKEITAIYNECEGITFRTDKQLKKCWENMKSRARAQAAMERGESFQFDGEDMIIEESGMQSFQSFNSRFANPEVRTKLSEVERTPTEKEAKAMLIDQIAVEYKPRTPPPPIIDLPITTKAAQKALLAENEQPAEPDEILIDEFNADSFIAAAEQETTEIVTTVMDKVLTTMGKVTAEKVKQKTAVQQKVVDSVRQEIEHKERVRLVRRKLEMAEEKHALKMKNLQLKNELLRKSLANKTSVATQCDTMTCVEDDSVIIKSEIQ